jgi:hypothetical protein
VLAYARLPSPTPTNTCILETFPFSFLFSLVFAELSSFLQAQSAT